MTADLQKFTDGIDAALRTSHPTAALRALFVAATTDPATTAPKPALVKLSAPAPADTPTAKPPAP